MSISELFEDLGAPLNNRMWSWGAVRESDKTVFLRVWQHGTNKYQELDGKYYTWLSDMDAADQSLGAAERRKHVDLIKNEGYKIYMIMCVSADIVGKMGSIQEFDDKEVRIGGKVVEHNGEILVEDVRRYTHNHIGLPSFLMRSTCLRRSAAPRD